MRFEKWNTTPIAIPDDRPEREAGGRLLGREQRLLDEDRDSTGCSVAAGSHSRLTMSCSGGIV